MDDILPQLKSLLMKLGLAAVAVGTLLILFRYVRQWYYQKHDRRNPPQIAQPSPDDPDEQDDTIPLANLRTSVRKWKVSGVEKVTGNDATWFIDAESRANAKVKAELKGMIVTAVERAAGEH